MGQILAGALGGLGFSIVFGVRKKYMALIASTLACRGPSIWQ